MLIFFQYLFRPNDKCYPNNSKFSHEFVLSPVGGGRMERRCWVNFQCWGVLLVWMVVGQGPIALAVGAGGGLFGHFFSHLSCYGR